jgi:DNA repair ATPase RecN
MPFSVDLIKKLERVSPELRGVLIALLEEVEKQREESVTKREFQEFTRRTEENFQKLWQVIRELGEAQKRTEARIEELAEAQKRTEVRVSRLEKVVEELAKAQKRTEDELKSLIKEHKKTRDLVSGLSDTVGYGLEDKIFPYIEDFARREYGVEVEVLDRRNVVYPDGGFDQVNIYIEGRKGKKRIYIVGECKAQPGKRDIKRFVQILERLRGYFKAPVEGFIVGYYYTPDVERYLRESHPEIKVMKSFEFEMKYKPVFS